MHFHRWFAALVLLFTCGSATAEQFTGQVATRVEGAVQDVPAEAA